MTQPPSPLVDIDIQITERAIDLTEITKRATKARGGAVSTFLGTTRDHFDGRKVKELRYEAYPAMAIKAMHQIANTILERFGGSDAITAIIIQHRIGVVPVEEASVVIAIGSVHRREGLEAVSWAIDELKATVPVFKEEVYEDGTRWKQNTEFSERRDGACCHKT
eukprot:PhF_6_TR4556/c0_g1_i1/m.6429/K03635/MOCS2B, moaE; molybdopterin synthase catalytic subunit